MRKMNSLLFFFTLMAANCIGLKGGVVPNQDKWVSAKKRNINLCIEYSYALETIDTFSKGRYGVRADIYYKKMLTAIYKSEIPYRVAVYGYFPPKNTKKKIYLGYLEEEDKDDLPEYTIYFDLKQIEHVGMLDYVWAFGFGITLGILPMRQKETFILTMRVLDPEMNEIFRKQYADDAIAWFQLFLLPATPFLWPSRMEDEVAQNLFSAALKEFATKHL